MSTKIFKITRRVYRSPLRGINQNARVGTHEEMENAQNRLLRRNTTNRWTGTQFMGIYGSIVYGYLWQYRTQFMGLESRLGAFRGIYGGGRQKIYISAEKESEAFGGEIYIRNTPPYFLLSLLSSREKILSLFLPLSPYIT